MGAFDWLKDKALGEELEDYGEISRAHPAMTAPALSAKLTRKDSRLFLVLKYQAEARAQSFRVDVTEPLADHLRRIADDIERHGGGSTST